MSLNHLSEIEENGRPPATKKRLWVVSELYYPEETSTGYYLTKIAEGLAKEFEVKAICGQPNYSARDVTAPNYERHKGVEIFRVFGTRLNKNVIPYRIINMITLCISIFFKSIIGFQKNDLVLVVTNPPLLPFITAFSSILKRSDHILLIHDNYPEILIAANKTTESSVFTKILKKLNRWLYQKATQIIVVGRDMKSLVSDKMLNKDTSKIKVIPNWAELESVAPASRDENELIEELGLKDKIIFLYAGNMGYPNDIKSFIEVAKRLIKEDKYHFVFLGAGVQKQLLVQEVKKYNIDNITILNPKPRSEQRIFLNACDVAIVSLVKKMWGVSMPSRTYNILAVGKPILALCEEDSEIDKVVREDRIGWSITPENPGELLATIKHIGDHRHEFDEMGNRARRVALDKYSLEVSVEKYKRALNEINASDNVKNITLNQ
jgi:glycosyltransferase involved in cell wall biosynthesis